MTLTKLEIEQQLIAIITQLLIESEENLAYRKVTLHASLSKHLGIDSLGRAELFARIEKKLHIQLSDQALAESETVEDIVNWILQHSSIPSYQPQPTQPMPVASAVDPSTAKTLVDVLLLHALANPDRPHVYLQNEQGKEEILTYGTLLEQSLRIAHQLQLRALKPQQTVAIMQPTNLGFFSTFFGILIAGGIPVPIYPPFRPHQLEAYAQQEAKILRNAEVRLLITFKEAETLSKILRAFVPSLQEITTTEALLQSSEKGAIGKNYPDDAALIQYTSGSTSTPKGVLLTHQNLLANIRAYGIAAAVAQDDVAVSWVPLYHDLGLIGMWLGSLYHAIPLVLLSPLTFLHHPEKWLWAIHYHRGTLSGGPNFAYELCIRKIDPAMIEGIDLGSWRLALNGAEPIQSKTLTRFTQKFSPYGFKSTAFLPVYGLAESSVCVTTTPLNRGPLIEKISRDIFQQQHRAVLSEEDNSLEFVSCGIAIPGHEVRIVDEINHLLPERNVGRLQFRGPSSMQGYHNNPAATAVVFHDGWWDTGDLAYQANSEIFITGRSKDLIIKAGRNLYPAEIEELVGEVAGIRQGCIVAFGVTDVQKGTEKLIIIAESKEKSGETQQRMIGEITEKITTALDVSPDHVLVVPPRTIPKTSSGKLQRNACKTAYLSHTLLKPSLAPWLQIAKLGIHSILANLKKGLSLMGKTIYTTYMALLFLITTPFVWLSLQILPQHLAAIVCRSWARSIYFLGFCPIRIDGKVNLHLAQPLIYAANHMSNIDSLLLLAILPANTRLVGKQELWNIPIISAFMRKLGYIAIDRRTSKGKEEVQQIEITLQQGTSIAIFPEGTFSYAIGLRPFKLGAFKAAVATDTAICPIAIQGTRYIWRGEERLFAPQVIHITIGNPISPQGHDWQEINRLKNAVRLQIGNHCGEPTLDLITRNVAATRKELEHKV